MSAQYTVNQIGKPAGDNGRARRDISIGTITVRCTDESATYKWEVTSYPSCDPGEVPVIDNDAARETDIELFVEGGYLIRLTIDAGRLTEDILELYIGIPLEVSRKCIPALNETIQDNSQTWPSSNMRGAEGKLTAFNKWTDKNARGGVRKSAVIDYVPCDEVPPSEVDGDRYILDKSTGSVDPGWDGANKLDIVQFDGLSGLWVAETPKEGWVTYVDDRDMDILFVSDPPDDPEWEFRPTVIVQHNDLINFDGGQPTEYYHLKLAEHTALTGSSDASSYHNHDSLYGRKGFDSASKAIGAGLSVIGSMDITVNEGMLYYIKAVAVGSTDDVNIEFGDASFSGSPNIIYEIGYESGDPLWNPDVDGDWIDRNPVGFVGLTGGVLYYRFTNNGTGPIMLNVEIRAIGIV